MHYGLLPRANRGIFAINELPDLAGKIQVGLFNILQEGDVQIKGYPIRLKLDVMLVFTANPEDYTARGKIITPLKDRIGSEIRTHYPGDARERASRSPRRKRGPSAPGGLKVEIPDVRARGRRGGRVPGARRSQDRQALRRQPAAADHDARARRLERRAARARQRREGRRAARHRPLRGAAVDHRQVRARVRRRAAGRRAGRARSDPLGGRHRLHRHVRRRRHAHGRRVVRPRRLAAAERRDVGRRGDRADARRAGAARAGRARRAGAAAPPRRPWPRRSTSCSRAVRAEEDQPQRRARLHGRQRSRAAPPGAARGTAMDEEIRMPGGKKKYYN